MNPFDEITDRLAELSCCKPTKLSSPSGGTEVFHRDDVLDIINEVEQAYNLTVAAAWNAFWEAMGHQ